MDAPARAPVGAGGGAPSCTGLRHALCSAAGGAAAGTGPGAAGRSAHPAWPRQASVELPAADAEAGALRECYAPALGWADAFWQGLFDRCARAWAWSAADQCWSS